MLKEGYLQEIVEGDKARCLACAHKCVMKPGQRGFCSTRINKGGKIFSLTYGMLSSEAQDPIEKKPLYNFWPGSGAYSVASVGCSFRCQFCQNWQISQARIDDEGHIAVIEAPSSKRSGGFPLHEITPEELVTRAKQSSCASIAFTYNEPIIWHEFVVDTSKLAHDMGLFTILVTNGYATPEAAAALAKVTDAANIDVKAFNDTFYKKLCGVPSRQPVLDTCEAMKKAGVHVELTTLLIPGQNDNPEEIKALAKWVLDTLGPDTPLHFSAYHPDYKFHDAEATPAHSVLKAGKIAQDVGLWYAYAGNIGRSEGNDSICHHCGQVLVHRRGFSALADQLTEEGTCKACGAASKFVGFVDSRKQFRAWF
jgi:pyruvate formate lyase activating enzyme